MAAKKKKVEIEFSPPPEPPHHHFFHERGIHTCIRCGFVLGSGNGGLPQCSRLTPNEIANNKKSGNAQLEKIRNGKST